MRQSELNRNVRVVSCQLEGNTFQCTVMQSKQKLGMPKAITILAIT